MKKMLMVYPNNFLQGAMGTNNRVMQLVRIFKGEGYSIDYFSYINFSPDVSFENFEERNAEEKLIDNLYLYDFSSQQTKGTGALKKIKVRLDRMCGKVEKEMLLDWAPEGARDKFKNILTKKQYDVIIIFYTYLANLLKGIQTTAKKVYFMEDSMFLQQYSWQKDGSTSIRLGKLMDEEIQRIKYFDKIFCISNDEKIFYEKICDRKMFFFPHLLPDEFKRTVKPVENRRWDLFFIGFDNPFNVEGMKWFFEEVYPLLPKTIRILLVGTATKHMEDAYENVDKILFVPDLNEIFEEVKISICPMFHGTGMKIKVVEAMAKGLPVVCNERGVDGLPDKTKSGCLVTDDKYEFADYIMKLLIDTQYYREIADNIFAYYEEIFDKDRYIRLFNKCMR